MTKTYNSLAALILAMGICRVPASAQTYHLTDLGASSTLRAISDGGIAAGAVSQIAHRFTPAPQSLGTLGGSTSFAYAVSGNGKIAGSSAFDLANGFDHAFLYENGAMRDLGTLPDRTRSLGFGVNSSGWVVGTSYNLLVINSRRIYSQRHAFLYDGMTMRDLGTLGGERSDAMAINDQGQIVGESRLAFNPATFSTDTHAFLFENGTMQDLGVLGENSSGNVSSANAINAQRQIVGTSTTEFFHPFDTGGGVYENHAFLYENGVMQDLGVLEGGYASTATGINAQGLIVGTANRPHPGSTYYDGRGFLYRNGTLHDLTDLLDTSGAGWIIGSASGINAQGQIVAQAIAPNFEEHGVLLTPNVNYTVRGTVQLDNSPAEGQRVTLTFRSEDGAVTVVREVTLSSTGTFEVADVPADHYTLHVKGSKWLARNVLIDATAGDVSDLMIALKAGDANNDNFTDIQDLLLLLAHYNQHSPAAGYLEATDFNNDGADDIGDLLPLVANYNLQGDSLP